MNFQNKVVLITGGGGLIGKECAKAYGKLGAKVILNGRNIKTLEKAAEEIDPDRTYLKIFAGDIKNVDTSKKLIDYCKNEFGRLDILINNAGVYVEKPFLEHTEADFDDHMDCIVKGAFFLSQEAAKLMIQQGGGIIVNIGSSWGIAPVKATPSSAHSIAKAGLHMLTKSLAVELAPYKIRVNAISPGAILSPTDPDDEKYRNLHLLGRIGRPADICSALLYLTSDEASWITGAILPVDGGVSVAF